MPFSAMDWTLLVLIVVPVIVKAPAITTNIISVNVFYIGLSSTCNY